MDIESVKAWWLDRLLQGTATKGAAHWPGEAPDWPDGRPGEIGCKTLHDDYLAMAKKSGHRSRNTPAEFGMALRELLPKLIRVRSTGTDGERTWSYRMPTLQEAREDYACAVGQPIDWDGRTIRNSEESVSAAADRFIAAATKAMNSVDPSIISTMEPFQ